jgi:ABC-type lipoprotein export system ATPase subunit
VRLLGRSTAEMVDSADWLATLDRFGIVSERAVLLESLSVVQNLAVPFSLEIEPPSDAVRQQAVALAHEVGVDEAVLERAVVDLSGAERVRVRLARALAFNPLLLLLEHPSAFVDRADVSRLGRDIRRIAERREAATIGLTVDRDFASAAASRVLSLDPATGGLSARR